MSLTMHIESRRMRGILVRAVVALRTGLAARDSIEELDNEIEALEVQMMNSASPLPMPGDIV